MLRVRGGRKINYQHKRRDKKMAMVLSLHRNLEVEKRAVTKQPYQTDQKDEHCNVLERRRQAPLSFRQNCETPLERVNSNLGKVQQLPRG